MAASKSHFSFATLIALAYAFFGFFLLEIGPEYVILASLVVIIAGMLPDIDSDNGETPKEIGGLIAAISPLVVLELYPELRGSGTARLALVVIVSYFVTRLITNRFFSSFTSPRGLVHSIPAAILVFELVYLFFSDLPRFLKLYISFGAFLGYFSHLLLDATGNIDLMAKAMGNKGERQGSALALFGRSAFSSLVLYGFIIFLGYYVIQDLYPGTLPEISYNKYF